MTSCAVRADDRIIDLLSDQEWRLNNLYWIKNKQGRVVKFAMNSAQIRLFNEMHYLNVILKARQHGFTTIIDLYLLDCVLFNRDVKAGIIAHHIDDAHAIYEDKIKYPWDMLDEDVKAYLGLTAETDRVGHITFSNGSSIRVSTSFRSGTLQLLHVSELGKIAAKYPDKAKEIRTGAFEAVGQGQKIFVESTAEGREGEFHELCMRAKRLKDAHKAIGPMDFKFHFFAWWENPEYKVDPDTAVFTEEMVNYFDLLRGRGINLSKEQKAWYIKKKESLKDDMTREYPSYPEEAFDASVEGAYYAPQMAAIRRQGRIGHVPHDPMFPVDTMWDLGMDDSMSIWFVQTIAMQRRAIDYYESSGEGMTHYAGVLNKRGYSYGTHYMPHDISVRELGTGKSRKDVAHSLGIHPIVITPRPKNTDALLDQIEAVRNYLASVWIDENRCAKGIPHLDNYRKDWDEKNACYRTPRHDAACHGADAMRTGAVSMLPAGYEDDTYEPECEEVY